MGNVFNTNVNQNRQVLTTEIYQAAEAVCAATCENIQSGNTIFIDGSTTGNIVFDQTCTANAGCMMENAVESVITELQEIRQSGQLEAGLFPNFGNIQLNVSDQELRNQVTQILSSTCDSNSSNIQQDNLVYARNSTTGNIAFTQTGNAAADCQMANSANSILNVRQTGDQNNAISGWPSLGTLIGIAVVIVAIVLISTYLKNRKEQQEKEKTMQGMEQKQNGETRQQARTTDSNLGSTYSRVYRR